MTCHFPAGWLGMRLSIMLVTQHRTEQKTDQSLFLPRRYPTNACSEIVGLRLPSIELPLSFLESHRVSVAWQETSIKPLFVNKPRRAYPILNHGPFCTEHNSVHRLSQGILTWNEVPTRLSDYFLTKKRRVTRKDPELQNYKRWTQGILFSECAMISNDRLRRPAACSNPIRCRPLYYRSHQQCPCNPCIAPVRRPRTSNKGCLLGRNPDGWMEYAPLVYLPTS